MAKSWIRSWLERRARVEASSNTHQTLRQLLVEEQKLHAVISLPGGVFKPYADGWSQETFNPLEYANAPPAEAGTPYH